MPKSVLVTGAGGPAAYTFIQAVLRKRKDIKIIATDMDRHAAGLYLVPAEQRALIPRADASNYWDVVSGLIERHAVDLVVPTVDRELPLFAARKEALTARGVTLLSAELGALQTCLSKDLLIEALRGKVPVPDTKVIAPGQTPSADSFPCFAKPANGAGGRGAEFCDTLEAFTHLRSSAASATWLLQEFLPGAEYSVDVLATPQGVAKAAVVRERLKIDSGVAVTARVLRDATLEANALAAVNALKLGYVSNVQWRRAKDGTPKLLEINARFPGTMPLTVRAGVDMPNLALSMALGESVPETFAIEEIAMVRTWAEHFVSATAFAEVR